MIEKDYYLSFQNQYISRRCIHLKYPTKDLDLLLAKYLKGGSALQFYLIILASDERQRIKHILFSISSLQQCTP